MAEANEWLTALSTSSSTREQVLEHRFLADVCSELWRRGIFDFAVSHSEVDNSGYDVILEVGDVVRHVQLKSMHLDGKAAGHAIQTRLEAKPSACVIVIRHHAVTLQIEDYLWFGSAPGLAMPALGDSPVRHTKGNSLGIKSERPALRELKRSRFEPIRDIGALGRSPVRPAAGPRLTEPSHTTMHDPFPGGPRPSG